MGRFLVVTWEGGGNVTPMVLLAGALASRGHDVGAVAPTSLQDRFLAAGTELVLSPDGWLASAADVLGAVERFAPGVVVVDYMLTGARCGAEAAALPTVALVHTLYGALLLDGAPNPIGMSSPVDALNDVRGPLGLDRIERHADLLDTCELVVVAAPRQLDDEPPGSEPANVVYAGPIVESADPSTTWEPPGGPADEWPLVVVSLGTAGADPAREAAVLGRIIEALGKLPVRGLVNLPTSIDPATFDPPDRVELAGYVPHAAVLPHADLVVTHAGLGTVNAALVHGLNLVCLPLDREQPDNARAVERIRAGCVLDPDATADEVATAIEHQLQRERPAPLVVDLDPTLDRIEALVR